MVVLGVFSIFLALLFCIFVCVMFYDQISCIVENMSTIDKLQHKRAMQLGQKVMKDEPKQKPRTGWENICEVMTGDHRKGMSFDWLYPCDIEIPLRLEGEYN